MPKFELGTFPTQVECMTIRPPTSFTQISHLFSTEFWIAKMVLLVRLILFLYSEIFLTIRWGLFEDHKESVVMVFQYGRHGFDLMKTIRLLMFCKTHLKHSIPDTGGQLLVYTVMSMAWLQDGHCDLRFAEAYLTSSHIAEFNHTWYMTRIK